MMIFTKQTDSHLEITMGMLTPVRTFNTLGYLYSASAYVLLLMFCVISILWDL